MRLVCSGGLEGLGGQRAAQPLVRVPPKAAVRSQAGLGGHCQRPYGRTRTAAAASGPTLRPEAELGVGGQQQFLPLSHCYMAPLASTPLPVQLLPGMAGDRCQVIGAW